MTRHAARGFTLVELIVVLACLGLLLSIAAPRYINQVDASRESVLRHNLDGTRQAIEQFFADKGRYPHSLQELVDQRYLRSVPVDPMTERSDTWQAVAPPGEAGPAWANLHSGAAGTGRNGVPYAAW
jgi:general secretion pathway protein G